MIGLIITTIIAFTVGIVYWQFTGKGFIYDYAVFFRDWISKFDTSKGKPKLSFKERIKQVMDEQ